MIIRSRFSEQFVLRVPSEYDYHFSSPRVAEVTHVLQRLHAEAGEGAGGAGGGPALEVRFVDDKDLTVHAITKAKAGAPGAAKPARRPSAAQVAKDMGNLGLGGEGRSRAPTVMHFSREKGKQVDLDDFELLKVLGKGSFGKVLQVKKKDTKEIFAMKILHKDAVLERNQLEHTKAERHILESVQHPFLVGLRYAFQSEAKLYMVLDFLNGGKLFFHLKASGRFSEARAKLYGAEILLALGHLHSLDIVYRDLKPENILMDAEGHVRLTDFGLAKEQVSDNSSAQTFCGTPEYLAPEVLTSQGHGRAVDWWSLGTLIYEMMCGLPPFYDQNVNKMYNKIVKAPLVFPDYFSNDAKDMLAKLLDRDPHKRLGSGPTDIEEIKSHPYFSSIDFDKLMRKDIKPPFKPNVADGQDVQNFDTCFTLEEARDSVVAAPAGKADTSNFDGFTLVPKNNLG